MGGASQGTPRDGLRGDWGGECGGGRVKMIMRTRREEIFAFMEGLLTRGRKKRVTREEENVDE